MSNAPAMHVSLLDGFLLKLDGLPSCDPLPPSVQRLVASVSLSDRPARSAVAGQLWPEVREEQALRNLRSALWRLNKTVPGLLDVSGGAVSLARGVTLDVRELTDWARGVLDPEAAVLPAHLTQAYRHGELLPGWYDDWVLIERDRLRQLRMYALEVLAAKLACARRFAEAVQAAYAVIQVEPLRESAHRTLIRLHLGEGNTVEAVRVYDRFREILLAEVGMAPSPQMRELLPAAYRHCLRHRRPTIR